jgi:hypothetical protein
MNVWRLNPGYRARLAVAGAVVGACALMASPTSVLANAFTCPVVGVAVVPGSRIHVRCNPGDGAIFFFALNIGNPDTSRVLSIATTAVATRRPVQIFYNPNDLSGAAIGCRNEDCRLLEGIEVFRE